jgi:hypothetical protein
LAILGVILLNIGLITIIAIAWMIGVMPVSQYPRQGIRDLARDNVK